MYGKSIELFLVNGTAESLITAELSNWNGKAIKIPRTEVAECERDDIKGVGVYFLFCKEEDGGDSVYIGEAENVLDRLKQNISIYMIYSILAVEAAWPANEKMESVVNVFGRMIWSQQERH